MLIRRLVLFLVLILGTIIWVPADLNGWEINDGNIYIYVVSNENQGACGMDRRLELGSVEIYVDSSNVVTGYRSKVFGKIEVEPDWGSMFSDGRGDQWRRNDYAKQWWKSQLTDITTSYCGVVRSNNRDSNIQLISDADLQKLRGVIITEWPASLKLTITGPHVKVEPMETCCSSEGECVKQVLWQRPSICPEGTTKPAGKASTCAMCKPAKEVPVPSGSLPDEEQEEKRGCCLSTGCEDFTPTMCGMRYGEPLDRLCSGNDEADCANLTGACMVEEICIPSQTKANCEDGLIGKYSGNGRECPPSESEKRACCIVDNCELMTREACKKINGARFMDDQKTCEPGICMKVKGGCCYPTGDCKDNVTLGDCLINKKGNKFFPGGCSEDCKAVLGACFMACPNESGRECEMLTQRECESRANSHFEHDKKCTQNFCPNFDCSQCFEAYGTWFYPDNNTQLTLNPDCTSRMNGLITTNSAMMGNWSCNSSDRIISFIWPDLSTAALTMVGKGGTLKLCYPDGDKVICAERNQTDAGMGVRREKFIHGTKP